MVLYILMGSLFFIGIFMVLLVLVQRGKGGVLTGGCWDNDGQSAFGNRPTDMFTKITIGTACVWILLCVITVKYLGSENDGLDNAGLGKNATPVDGLRSGPSDTPAPTNTPAPSNTPAPTTPAPNPDR